MTPHFVSSRMSPRTKMVSFKRILHSNDSSARFGPANEKRCGKSVWLIIHDLSLSLPHYFPIFSHSISVSLTFSRPHSLVLLGFLLFLGWHVCPDHVGDASHTG